MVYRYITYKIFIHKYKDMIYIDQKLRKINFICKILVKKSKIIFKCYSLGNDNLAPIFYLYIYIHIFKYI